MPQSSKPIVFDASAVLAVALHEPGYQELLDLESVALVSAVNLAEVRSRLWDKGSSVKAIDDVLAGVSMSIIAFDAEQARVSAELRPVTRALGLSLGDRACIALGLVRDAVVYTADRIWAKLQLPIEIRVIR
jgi:PIN domain nuclease of toxin-antitoxin system